MKSLAAAILSVLLCLCTSACRDAKKEKEKENASDKVSFATDIKPLFESSCLSCHHTGTLLGHLNLETRKLAFTPGPRGPFIVPGKPTQSLLYNALLLPKLEDAAMPPEGHRIEQEEIRLIHNWILQGAEWPEGEAGRLTPTGTRKPAAA